MLDNIFIPIVVGVTVGVVVALFVQWLNRNSTKEAVHMSFNKATDLIKRQDFLREAGIFKSAFIKIREAVTLDETHDLSTFEILRSEIPNQERAIVRFEMYLPRSRRIELWQAWKEYSRKDEADFSDEYFTKDQLEGADISSNKEKQLILERIDKILHFTDPNFVFKDI